MNNFKTWIEVYLNPLFYDMSSPEGRAEYEREKTEYGQRVNNRNQIKEISREPHRELFVLTCWRGCTPESLELMTVQRGPSYRILDSRRSRSGAIWFAHQFQTGGKENAFAHGEIVMTYPLKCSAYYDVVKYSNGRTEREPSEDMLDKVQVYSECPFGVFGNMVLGLPNGWTFSEHGEKHVLCETTIVIQDDMIS